LDLECILLPQRKTLTLYEDLNQCDGEYIFCYSAQTKQRLNEQTCYIKDLLDTALGIAWGALFGSCCGKESATDFGADSSDPMELLINSPAAWLNSFLIWYVYKYSNQPFWSVMLFETSR